MFSGKQPAYQCDLVISHFPKRTNKCLPNSHPGNGKRGTACFKSMQLTLSQNCYLLSIHITVRHTHLVLHISSPLFSQDMYSAHKEILVSQSATDSTGSTFGKSTYSYVTGPLDYSKMYMVRLTAVNHMAKPGRALVKSCDNALIGCYFQEICKTILTCIPFIIFYRKICWASHPNIRSTSPAIRWFSPSPTAVLFTRTFSVSKRNWWACHIWSPWTCSQV